MTIKLNPIVPLRRIRLADLELNGTMDTGGNPHWRLFAQFSNPRGEDFSVEVNPETDVDSLDLRLILTISTRTYKRTRHHNIHRSVPFSETQPIDASTFIELIENSSLTRYRFATTGNGCRFWCTRAIRWLERGGWLVAGSEETVLEWLRQQAEIYGQHLTAVENNGSFGEL